MNCPLLSENTLDVLLDYSAGKLDKGRSVLLERHMMVCSACAAFRSEQAAVWEALDAWEPEPVSMGFNRTLWQKIGALAAAPWYTRLHFNAWKPAFTLAGAAMLIAAGFVYDQPGHNTAPAHAGVVQGVSISDADQVEKTLDDIQLLSQFDSVSGTSKTM